MHACLKDRTQDAIVVTKYATRGRLVLLALDDVFQLRPVDFPEQQDAGDRPGDGLQRHANRCAVEIGMSRCGCSNAERDKGEHREQHVRESLLQRQPPLVDAAY